MTSGTSSARIGGVAASARPRRPIRLIELLPIGGRDVGADVGGHLAADDRQLRLLGRLVGRHHVVAGPDRGDHRRRAAGARPARAGAPSRRAPRPRCRSGSPSGSGSGRGACPSSCPSSLRPTSRCRAAAGARSRTRAGRGRSAAPPRPRRTVSSAGAAPAKSQGRAPTRARDRRPTKRPERGRTRGACRPRSSQASSGGMSSTVDAPGEHHPQAADHAELAEAAELHGDERGVGDARRQRRRQRPPARPPQRHHQRLLDGLPLAARLEIAGQLDDAEVDAVADDDRAQERRVRVELGDAERRQAGQAEGVDRRQRQRQEQRRDAARPAVEEDDGQQRPRRPPAPTRASGPGRAPPSPRPRWRRRR